MKLPQSHEKNKYPDKEFKVRLALQVGLRTQQVIRWFINRRHMFIDSKNRRLNVTITEQFVKNM